MGWGALGVLITGKAFIRGVLQPELLGMYFFCLQGDEPITGRCLLVGRGGGGGRAYNLEAADIGIPGF